MCYLDYRVFKAAWEVYVAMGFDVAVGVKVAMGWRWPGGQYDYRGQVVYGSLRSYGVRLSGSSWLWGRGGQGVDRTIGVKLSMGVYIMSTAWL